MQFSNSGKHLASVAGDPDHMLTIWDWENNSIILRAKAFSQDIYTVCFSPFDQVILFLHLCVL